MRIGFIQMTPEFGEVTSNVDIAENLIRETEADLLVTPGVFQHRLSLHQYRGSGRSG